MLIQTKFVEIRGHSGSAAAKEYLDVGSDAMLADPDGFDFKAIRFAHNRREFDNKNAELKKRDLHLTFALVDENGNTVYTDNVAQARAFIS